MGVAKGWEACGVAVAVGREVRYRAVEALGSAMAQLGEPAPGVVAALIAAGADVERADNDHITPLYIASSEGHASVAIETVLQPGEKSFTDADLKAIADRVIAAAAKLGAQLRG